MESGEDVPPIMKGWDMKPYRRVLFKENNRKLELQNRTPPIWVRIPSYCQIYKNIWTV